MRKIAAAWLLTAAMLAVPLAALAAPAGDAALKAEAFIAARVAVERAHLAPAAPPLAADATLADIARARSQAMAEGAPFSHQDASGAYPAFDMVRARLAPFHGAIGENLAMETWTDTAFDPDAFAMRIVEGWMKSAPHRANILSAKFDRAGIGVFVKGSAAYVTQVFAGPPTHNGTRVIYDPVAHR